MPQRASRLHRGPRHLIDLLLASLLVAIALATRLPALDVFITPDEYRWVCRSVLFHRGLATGQLAQTRQTGHPGVLTMWLGVPAMGIDPLQPWLDPCSVAEDPEALTRAAPDMAARLAEVLYRGRRGVAVFTALALGLAFLLLVRLVGRPTAWVAGALLLIDPFLLAHSRLLHLDAISACMLFLFLLSGAIAVRENDIRFWALSGVCAALATANKSPSGLAFPLTLLTIGLWCWRCGVLWRRALQATAAWVGAGAVAFVACWPAMWVQPIRTLGLVLGTAMGYAQSPHASGNFFWGMPTANPGPAFYPVAMAFRLTPWTLLGAALSLPWLLPPGLTQRVTLRLPLGRRVSVHADGDPSPAAQDDNPTAVSDDRANDPAIADHRRTLRLLWGFLVAYALFMTAGQKKFDRYILPTFPPLQVAAALGLALSGRWLASRVFPGLVWRGGLRHGLAAGVAAAGLALGAVAILPHAPYYLTYYNPLLGGGRAAVSKILVGWGEGLDQAVGYLNDLPAQPEDRAINRLVAPLASQYRGQPGSSDDYDITITDYVILYVNEVQRGLDVELLQHYYLAEQPLTVVRLHGVDYAWVYANTAHEEPIAQIGAEGDVSRDRIVISRPSLFAKHYHGPLPMETLSLGNDRQEILDALRTATGGAQRIWYVRYPDEDAGPGLEWADFLWETHAFKLDERDYSDIRLSLWQTRGADTFEDQVQPTRPLGLRFGDDLLLSGHTALEPTVQWGRGLGLLLHWRTLRAVERDYAVSVKMVDQAGRVWGQGDRWISDESLVPTSLWEGDHQGTSHVAVNISPGTPPGDYALRVAVYDRVSREPLPLDSTEKENGGLMGSTTVVPSPRHPEAAELPIGERRELQLTPELRMLGWSLERTTVRFGEPLSLSLFWQATAQPQGDYRARIQVLGDDLPPLAQGDFAVAGESYPTSRWPAGETIGRPYDLRIAEDAPATDARLTLVLLDQDDQFVAGPIDLAALRIEGHYYAPPAMGHRQEARLGEQVALLGYDLEASEVHPGEAVALTLYWRAREPIQGQYKIFVHLLGADGKLWGQKDALPLDSYYTTEHWRTDEVIVDRYTIPVVADAPRGRYRLAIGMYDPSAEGRRLPVVDGQGIPQPDDRLLLDMEIVVP